MLRTCELAYWVGIVQTDGCFRKYFNKVRNYDQYIIQMNVSEKSLPMIKRFQEISNAIFGRKSTIYLDNRKTYFAKICIKNFLSDFESEDIQFSDPPKPPKWVFESDKLFGAYLAGIIDGDGSVAIKRPKYPQCGVKITSGMEQTQLRGLLLQFGYNSSIFFHKTQGLLNGRLINGAGYDLGFYVSSKNYLHVEENIVPWISISYKRDKLLKFIKYLRRKHEAKGVKNI